jgi:hypothetical protein
MEIQSQPLNQAWIWTVDVTPYRSLGDRDLERQEHNATGMSKMPKPDLKEKLIKLIQQRRLT